MFNIDNVKKRDSPLTLNYKFLCGTYVQDIILISSHTSGAMSSNQGIIFTLRETCRELDESIRTKTTRKTQLERLIKNLVKK